MRVATDYPEAFKIFNDAFPKDMLVLAGKVGPDIAVDIGRQFGTTILMHMSKENGLKLLTELQRRDLPCPQVFWHDNKILIGVEPK